MEALGSVGSSLVGSSGWWRTHRGPLLVGALGAAVSLLVASVARGREARRERVAFERRCDSIAAALEAASAGPVEALRSVPALFASADRVDRPTFERFVGPALRRHPGLTALEWLPRVGEGERAAFEALAALETPGYELREPALSGAMVRAAPRPEHFVVTYMAPFSPQVLGLDIAFDPARLGPARRALETGDITVSDRYRLVEDPEGVSSVVVYAPVEPVWRPPGAGEGAGARGGVAVALFRLRPLVEASLAHLDLSGLELSLSDPGAPEALRLLYESRRGPGGVGPEGHLALRPLRFADRTYELRLAGQRAGAGAAPWAIGLGGLAASLSAAALLLERGRSGRLRRRVERAERLGQYELEGKIGEGGMGSVYRARHALMRRPTALKLLTGAEGAEAVARFEREVKLTCRLTHPNTIAIYDYGSTPEGIFYYAMELIEGFHLGQLVALEGPLPPARALRVLIQACGSLAEAHEAGLVHRDVKPQNIMLCVRGGVHDFVKVLDFGLVKEVGPGAGGRDLSVAGTVTGTPAYLAPETLLGEPPSPAVDVYGLGCVGYFLLTGVPPFDGDSVAEICSRVLTGALPPPSARLGRPVPAELERILMDCLAKSPGGRPASARELAERLRRCQASAGAWAPGDAEAWWRRYAPPPQPGRPERPERVAVSFAGRR
ncbi:MAG TPA: CHASE domain-containing protein [Polyangiaceae bacterium]|nr:CHASE domain-containing protein [Polyangiaceae bacterium]